MEMVDWLVVGGYFAVLLCLAWWVISKNKDTADDYFLAGRNLGWFIVGASIFASNIGSEHLVGLAGSGTSDGVAMAHYELHAWCLLVLAWVLVLGIGNVHGEPDRVTIQLRNGGQMPGYFFLPRDSPEKPLPAVVVAAGAGGHKLIQYQMGHSAMRGISMLQPLIMAHIRFCSFGLMEMKQGIGKFLW